MKPTFIRRFRRHNATRSEGGFFKKQSQESFFGEPVRDIFFQPPVASSQKMQRKCDECEKEGKVQKKEANASTIAGNNASSYISSLPGKGQPLPPSINHFFSSRMGYDFSDVKIHNDSNAAASTRDIDARAYTIGNNIVFNDGEYNTGTGEGRKLMAHELTHVMQNGSEGERINRKVTYDKSVYSETDPIKTALGSRNLALTTPVINGTPLPAKDFDEAGKIIFAAFNKGVNLERKDGKVNCHVLEPDIKVSANIAIIKKPTKAVWQGTANGSEFKAWSPVCEKTGTVTVYVKGKKDVSAIDVYNKVDKNENEHVEDLKKTSDKYFVPFIEFLKKFGSQPVSNDDKKNEAECQALYIKYVGKKDTEMIAAFLKELSGLVADRDKKGKSHYFEPDVRIDGKDCFNVVVKI